MTNRILKGLAVAAGTGLAMGLTSGRTKTVRVRVVPDPWLPRSEPAKFSAGNPPESQPSAGDSPDEFLDIEPLLDRLERLEDRVDSIASIAQRQAAAVSAEPVGSTVSGAASFNYAAAVADLERRVEQNTRELELLRQSITEAEGRMSQSVASVERKLERTRAELPAIIEPHVTSRIDDLRIRFSAEIKQAHQRTLEVFERAIDEKISSRIGSIEKALAEQAGSIEALNQRATVTDTNLQRLVTAIERLCERAQLIPPVSEQQFPRGPLQRPAQFEGRAPFESQLKEAMNRSPAKEPAPEAQVPAPALVSEPKKPRFLFRSLMVAGFSLFAARFLR